MPIPTLITDLSTTAASNYPAGSDSPSVLDDVQRAHASFIAKLRDESAKTVDLAASSGSSLIGHLPAGMGAVTTTVQGKLRESVSVLDFGGSPSASAAVNTAAIAAAAVYANNTAIVDFPDGTYAVTGSVEMPMKVSGNFTIDGDVQWTFKKAILQLGQITVTGAIVLDSVWFSKFTHLECVGNLTLKSTNATWGTFWNDFGTIRCATLIIDVDQGQSVNQNNFTSCKCSGGIHIQGVAVSGIREAHNNVFFSVDTTGASLTATDGTVGCHILNDSVLDQTNTVVNWYAETSGGRFIKGNWNVLGDNVDATSPVFMGGRENYRLGARLQGRQSSYLPFAVNNASQGGDWSELAVDGKPLGLGGSGSVVAITNAVDGNTTGIKAIGGSTFVSINLVYNLTESAHVSATAFVYQEGSPSQDCEIYWNGVLQGSGAVTYTSLGSGWYLARISGPSKKLSDAGAVLQGYITLYTTVGTALTAADFRILSSFFVTTESTCPLPSVKLGRRTGYGTTTPTGGIWARGDICWNTTPSAAGTPGWVCTVAGTPGTWKAMAVLGV